MSRFFHLQLKSDAVSFATKQWESANVGKVICGACHSHKPGVREVNVALDYGPESVPLSLVSGIATGLISEHFIRALGEDMVKQCLYLGAVSDSNGKVVPGYHTFVGMEMAIIRGDETSTERHCNRCGRYIYFPMGKWHFRADACPRRPICESNLYQLVVNDEVMHALDTSDWPDITFEEIPIVRVRLES